MSEESSKRDALDWAVDAGTVDLVLEELGLRRARRTRRRVALGTVLAACLVLATSLQLRDLVSGPAVDSPAVRPPSVVVVAPLTMELEDGSRVELNDSARIEARYQADLRLVELIEGEAHFAVAKDASRPFVVRTGDLAVRAIGTAFSVARGHEGVSVVVTEGRVSVDRSRTNAAPVAAEDSGAEILVVADAGHRVRVAMSGPEAEKADREQTGGAALEPVTPEEIATVLAWRSPLLEFSGTPLRDAVDAFMAHGAPNLILEDRRMGNLRMSGRVRAGNLDALIHLLEMSFGIEAMEQGDGSILLRRVR